MDFKSLLSKMNELDSSSEMPHGEVADMPATEDMRMASSDKPLIDTEMEECGMPGMSNMPSGMMGSPKQQDNVTMNISMNGSGAGGIRDLMNVLKDIQDSPEHDHSDNAMVIGMEEAGSDGGFADATTEPNERTAPMDAVTPTGDDLHSKGREAEKVNGGGNPFNVDESLIARLADLYTEVKGR